MKNFGMTRIEMESNCNASHTGHMSMVLTEDYLGKVCKDCGHVCSEDDHIMLDGVCQICDFGA